MKEAHHNTNLVALRKHGQEINQRTYSKGEKRMSEKLILLQGPSQMKTVQTS